MKGVLLIVVSIIVAFIFSYFLIKGVKEAEYRKFYEPKVRETVEKILEEKGY